MSEHYSTNNNRKVRPLATLFLGSGAAAIVVAVGKVVGLTQSVGIGRLRQLDLLWLPQHIYHIPLPLVAWKSIDLTSVSPFFAFLSLTILTSLLLHWVLAAVLSPVVVLGTIVIPHHPSKRLASWLWRKAYPAAVFVLFILPSLLRPVHYDLGGQWQRWKTVGVTIGIGIILWSGLLLLLQRPKRARWFLRMFSIFTIAVIILSLVGASIAIILDVPANKTLQPYPASPLPNILLVSIDSLRADHLHCYGYPRETSPTMDTLAEEGVLFTTVVAPTSWTLPSHLTLFTSLPPEEHGVIRDRMRLSPEVRTLTDVLWQAGYETAGIVAGHYLMAEYGFSRGFDHYDDYNLLWRERFANHGTRTPEQLPLAKEWLAGWDKRGRKRPFFLFLHMWDVHFDYTPPPPYDTLFDPDYQGRLTGEDIAVNPLVHEGMDPRDLEHLIALYDGEIRFSDFYLRKILDVLKTLEVYDDTIIVVTADHGEEFFEHGRKIHRFALYDESILVPFIIRYPRKIPAGKVVEQQVRLMDVAPTILGLAGLAQPADFGSTPPERPHTERDLTPLIVGNAPSETGPLVGFSDLHGKLVSVRTETFKLITHLRKPQTQELYDLVTDPAEQVNITAARPRVAAMLRQELSEWRKVRGAKPDNAREFRLTEEQEKQLRALGYLD